MKTILAPIDFSSASDRSLKAAADLARATGGRLVVLHIVPLPVPVYYAPEVVFDLSKAAADEEKVGAKRLARIHSRLQKELDSAFVKVETIQKTGAVVGIILDEQKRLAADYIVIGSHGHGAVYEALVGSTTKAVLKSAMCPVLVVPTGAKTEDNNLAEKKEAATSPSL